MLKVLQKQYQLIEIEEYHPFTNNIIYKYAIKYRNSDHVADYFADRAIKGYNRHDWIDSVDIKPKEYKEISFKKFREDIY